jgi:hypothetical protein
MEYLRETYGKGDAFVEHVASNAELSSGLRLGEFGHGREDTPKGAG